MRTDAPEIYLPTAEDAGVMSEWRLPLISPPVPEPGQEITPQLFASMLSAPDSVLEITGRFLGIGSSARPNHVGHAPGETIRPPGRCHACRWFETRLFRLGEDADLDYLIYNVGQTRVPGETLRFKYETVRSPFEVVEILTTRRFGRTDERVVGEVYLSRPAGRALAQAAANDEALRQAYRDRGVA